MIEDPSADEILGAVAAWLDTLATERTNRDTYFARVASNALNIVRREAALAPTAEREAAERLKRILARDGTSEELNAALCAGLREATLGASTPGLLAHLKQTILRQIEIDQPNYRSPSVRRLGG